ERVVTVKARSGYAVAGLNVRTGLLIDGLSIRFACVNGRGLDLTQAYTSEWVGNQTGGSPAALDGGGAPAVGIFGDANDRDCHALGLIFLAPEAEADPPPTRPARRGAAKRTPPPPAADP